MWKQLCLYISKNEVLNRSWVKVTACLKVYETCIEQTQEWDKGGTKNLKPIRCFLTQQKHRALLGYLPAKIHKFIKGPLETCKPQSKTEKQAVEVLCRSEVIVILLDLRNGKVIV